MVQWHGGSTCPHQGRRKELLSDDRVGSSMTPPRTSCRSTQQVLAGSIAASRRRCGAHPKDRGAEQGDVDGSLECSLASGGVAAQQAGGALPWIDRGALRGRKLESTGPPTLGQTALPVRWGSRAEEWSSGPETCLDSEGESRGLLVPGWPRHSVQFDPG